MLLINNLSKKYLASEVTVDVLDNLSFAVNNGEFVVNSNDCRRLIIYEFQRVALWSLVCSVFAFVIINFIFQF